MVEAIVGDPEPPVLFVPVNEPPEIVAVPDPPVRVIVPQAVHKSVMAVFCAVALPPERL